MNRRATVYTIGVTLLAFLCVSVAFVTQSTPTGNATATVLVLSGFTLVAELLGFLLPNAAVGSVGFIANLACVLIVPSWVTIAAAMVVRLVSEVCLRRTIRKAIFNIALFGVTIGAAVLAFWLFRGHSLADYAGGRLVSATSALGLPFLIAYVMAFAVNFTLAIGYIAANAQRKFAEVWRETFRSTIGLDLMASPLVFLFAWVYIKFGPFAAAALWIPLLGFRQLHKTILELERNNSELLELMVKSMEARDPYTSGHSRRVQQFSIAIAQGLALPAAEIDKVSRAALLHDVGKIYEKYAPILRKPGKLTTEEWATMQQHPADGAALVSTMSRLHDVVAAIKHHHERWDGTGYPDGLAGETIPRISRIITFADTIDAMTSARPYRGTLSEHEVRAEIVRCRGTQFDPAIADKILSAPIWKQLFASISEMHETNGVKTPLALVSPARRTVGT